MWKMLNALPSNGTYDLEIETVDDEIARFKLYNQWNETRLVPPSGGVKKTIIQRDELSGALRGCELTYAIQKVGAFNTKTLPPHISETLVPIQPLLSLRQIDFIAGSPDPYGAVKLTRAGLEEAIERVEKANAEIEAVRPNDTQQRALRLVGAALR